MIASAMLAPATDPRQLVSPDLLGRLTDRVARDHQITTELAERCVVQALAFLQAAADHPGERLAPPLQVDWGWHQFILHTREYAEFCQRVAGRFLHHSPADGLADGGEAIQRTAQLMRSAGLPVDEELWRPEGSGCHNACHLECTG